MFENACKVIVSAGEELYAEHHQIVTIALPKLDSNINDVIMEQRLFLVQSSECKVSATSWRVVAVRSAISCKEMILSR